MRATTKHPAVLASIFFIVLAALAASLVLTPTKAYAEDYDPYTDGIIIMDINGNVLTSDSVIDINLIQQGILVKTPSDSPALGHQTNISPQVVDFTAGHTSTQGSNYKILHVRFTTLAANTTYSIILSSWGSALRTETALSFTTSGGSDEGNSSSEETGTKEDPTPQPPPTPLKTREQEPPRSLQPAARTTLAVTNTGTPGSDSSTGSDISSGNGADLTTTSVGGSTAESNVSGETLASLGTVHRIGKDTTAGQEKVETTEETSSALTIMFSGAPYLYVLFMSTLVVALPLGFFKRAFAARYKQAAGTRIT